MAKKYKNLEDLAKIVAADTGHAARTSEQILRAGFDALARLLAAEESLSIPNFGTFETKMHAQNKAFNLQANETIIVPARRTARFRPTGRLRQMVKTGDTTGTTRKSYRKS